MSRTKKVKSPETMALIGNYLTIRLPLEQEVSDETLESYKTALGLYDAYLKATGGPDGAESLRSCGLQAAKQENFNAKHVTGYLTWLRDTRGNKSRTLSQRKSAISSFLSYAAGEDLSWSASLVDVQKSVAIGAGRKDPDSLVGHMSEKAWQAIVSQPRLPKAIEHRNWALMVLMYETGARCSEVIGLQVKHVVFTPGDEKVFIKGKGGKHRVVPIRTEAAEVVRGYIERFHNGNFKSSDPLFFVNHGRQKCPLSRDCVNAFLKRYGEAARETCPEVPERVHAHLLRHTRAMHLREGGMSEEDLAEFLGHSDTSTVKVYAQASVEMKRKAMEAASGAAPESLAEPGFWEGEDSIIMRLEGPTPSLQRN